MNVVIFGMVDLIGHVNKNTLKKMMHLDLIPKSPVNLKHRCQICTKAKQPRKLFKSVEKNIVLLELIHSDICDSQCVLTHGVS